MLLIQSIIVIQIWAYRFTFRASLIAQLVKNPPAGDPGLIPGSGRSTGEGIGSLQYSWACLVTQLVKNPPAMQETWVRSLSWEDPLEKGKATYSSILACRIPWILQSMGSQKQYMLLIQSIIVIKIWVYHFIFIDSIWNKVFIWMAKFLISSLSSTHRYRICGKIVKGRNNSVETFTLHSHKRLQSPFILSFP